MKKLLSIAALGSLLAALVLAVAPAWADDVDQKIKTLEQELNRLKGEQMELKKEATAAAAAAPTFTYRPGAGATLEAADKSFAVGFAYELNYFFYNATDGNDARGSTVFDLFLRRNRPQITFCLNNCFYEWGLKFNLDTPDKTGDTQVNEQNQWLGIHFEQINPWFPTFTIGDRTSPVSFPYVSRSSSSSAEIELASDMLADSGEDTLSRKALALYWADRPIPGNLLPGVFTLSLEYKSGAGIRQNTIADTNHKQFQGTFGLGPFNQSKNPWLNRIKWGIGLQADSVDSRSAVQGRRLRIRTEERGSNRVTLFDANNIGDGTHFRLETGTEWGYGPYLLRAEGGVSKYESGKAGTANDGFHGVRGGYWRIGHELFLWSPKGLLTGSASTPHSLQLGWSFERSQADCGTGSDCSPGAGAFSRNHLLNRDLELWYFLQRNIRMGIWWWWYHSDNTPTGVQTQVGCKNHNATDPGKDCSWHTVNLGLQASF